MYTVYLHDLLHVQNRYHYHPKHKWCFSCVTPQREYFLAADSEPEMLEVNRGLVTVAMATAGAHGGVRALCILYTSHLHAWVGSSGRSGLGVRMARRMASRITGVVIATGGCRAKHLPLTHLFLRTRPRISSPAAAGRRRNRTRARGWGHTSQWIKVIQSLWAEAVPMVNTESATPAAVSPAAAPAPPPLPSAPVGVEEELDDADPDDYENQFNNGSE